MPRRTWSGRNSGGATRSTVVDNVAVALVALLLVHAVQRCGSSSAPPPPPPPLQPKLIGGSETDAGRFPYLVSVIARWQETMNHHTCGAMLVAPDIVLTAAHCPAPLDGVEIGRHSIDDDDGYDDFERFVFASTVRHPLYDLEYNRDYDFMLMKIHGRSAHPPLRLNGDAGVPGEKGDPMTIIGWGMIDYDVYELSEVLREIEVNYIPNDVCSRVEGRFEGKDVTYDGRLSDRMMCAADRHHRDDSCFGDSGGPLIKKGLRAEDDVLLGIVSYGFGCNEEDFPGIYARISSCYMDWLVPNICAMSDDPPAHYGCGGSHDSFFESEYASGRKFKINVRIEIKLDKEPYQTGWLLQEADSGKIVASAPIGSYGDYERYEEIVAGVAVDVGEFGSKFKFVMLDWEGDGMDSGKVGWYSVYVSNQLVVDEYGHFEGFSVEHEFAVSAPPTIEPTDKPTPTPTHVPTQSPTDPPSPPPTTSRPTTSRPTVTDPSATTGSNVSSPPEDPAPVESSARSQPDRSNVNPTKRNPRHALLLPLLVALGLSLTWCQ